MILLRRILNNIGPQTHKSYTDHLTDTEKQRLLALEDEIEQSYLGDEETAKKILAISNKPENERLELMAALVPVGEAGEMGVVSGMKNAFIYEDGDRMEKINDELKSKYLALPPPSEDGSIQDDISSMRNMQVSVMGDQKGSDNNADIFSERSVQLSQMSRRTGISNYSHSIISKLSRPVSLPKEKILREQAEGKLYKKNIKEIDDCLSNMRSTNSQNITEDQMSRLVDECKKENDRIEMLEANEDDEGEGDHLSYSYKQPSYAKDVVLYSDKNTKLAEAQEMIDELVMYHEALKRGEFLPIKGDEADEANEADAEESAAETQDYLDDEEKELRERLKAQEENLANIMKEIEEKEQKLKAAIEENNKYLDIEDGIDTKEGELSARSAAYKFSSIRGNALKLNKGHNPDVPEDKVIEELPDEDDEEESRLDEMFENAKHFNEDYDALQSSRDFHHSQMESEEQLTNILTDENTQRAISSSYHQTTEGTQDQNYGVIPEEEEKDDPNPNEST